MSNIWAFMSKYASDFYMPDVHLTDLIEILIISLIVYHIMLWIKNTRAWTLLKGITVLALFIFVAYIFRMNTILWLAERSFNVAVIAMVIVFQPELRKALEQLGQKNILVTLFPFETGREQEERFSDKTMNEIARAAFEMGKVKTGALIVIERNILLTEYERTGIQLDSLLSSQLLINIFEHNTPLHDGAVIVRGDRVVSATCYLPLSDNMELSKDLGTRHRAGVGISEVTDSLTVIVSEETGHVSVAQGGILYRNLDPDGLKERLATLQNKTVENKRFKLWKGRLKHEKTADE